MIRCALPFACSKVWRHRSPRTASTHFTTAGIGIALSSTAYERPAEMLRDADIAMCRAKAQGTSGCEVFDTEMHALVVRRLKVETELRKAIEHGDLRVFYQPIVRLATGRIAGVEALVRWWHNDSEIVSPGDFIEIAEETGLIVHIGRWVFKEACRQAHAWHVLFNSVPELAITINVSPRQFAQSNLVADVKAALEETKDRPASLQLEITESMAMSDPKMTITDFLRAQGYWRPPEHRRLRHGPFVSEPSEKLSRGRAEIDRSFVRGIEHDVESREIARLIVTLAHHLSSK